MEDVYVINVMSSPVRQTSHSTSLRGVAEVMNSHEIGSLIVSDEEGTPTGIITESDIVAVVASGADVDTMTAGDAMSEPIITTTPSETVGAAAQTMVSNSVKKLPVRSEETGEVVGMLTTTDLTQYIPQHNLSFD